jgi:toxin ParE1/3/4
VAQPAVAWTLHARQDLLSALRYLVQEAKSHQAAEVLLERVEAAAAALREFPERGRIVPELGPPRREILVEGYRLVYRVRSEIEILRLIHGRQDFVRAWKEDAGRS